MERHTISLNYKDDLKGFRNFAEFVNWLSIRLSVEIAKLKLKRKSDWTTHLVKANRNGAVYVVIKHDKPSAVIEEY